VEKSGSERKPENPSLKKIKDDHRDASKLAVNTLLLRALLNFSREFFRVLSRAAKQLRQ
jgi:hypothetical protein